MCLPDDAERTGHSRRARFTMRCKRGCARSLKVCATSTTLPVRDDGLSQRTNLYAVPKSNRKDAEIAEKSLGALCILGGEIAPSTSYGRLLRTPRSEERRVGKE